MDFRWLLGIFIVLLIIFTLIGSALNLGQWFTFVGAGVVTILVIFFGGKK